MSNHEGFISMNFNGEETMQRTALTVLVATDFGPNNKGTVGEPLDETRQQQLTADVANEKYTWPRSKRWICVDRRLVAGAQAGEAEADPQTAGGIVLTDTAADMMQDDQAAPLSELVARNTRAAAVDELEPVVHGDTHGGKAGCGANKTLRATLRSNAENIEHVTPLAWASSKLLGLDEWLREEDVTQSILAGQASADNESIWDATPEQVADIIVENGGSYEELEGDHDEAVTRVDFTENSFDKVRFAKDHEFPDGTTIGAFSASLGAYKAETFRRAAAHGQTRQEAALQVMRGVLFNIGVCKELSNEHMFLVGVGEASQA